MDKILKLIPRERITYLYSATMTKKVAKLQRAALHNPVRVEVSTKYQTVDKLQQSYIFIPYKYKVRYSGAPVQWGPSIVATHFVLYRGVAVDWYYKSAFGTQQSGLYRGMSSHQGVAFMRGSTVSPLEVKNDSISSNSDIGLLSGEYFEQTCWKFLHGVLWHV